MSLKLCRMSAQENETEVRRIGEEIRTRVNALIETVPALQTGDRPVTRALIILARTQPAVFGNEAAEIERRLSVS